MTVIILQTYNILNILISKINIHKIFENDIMETMDDSVKMILKKLDDIDTRLKSIEVPGMAVSKVTDVKPVKKEERDPLFPKAVEFMDKFDEISSKQLSENLKIDLKRAEVIMDQLESAGFGTCYTKDV